VFQVDGYPSALIYFNKSGVIEWVHDEYLESMDDFHLLLDYEENVDGFIEFLQKI